MGRPQVIDDEEHEQVHERVAAVDVAKDSGVVCTRTPHPSRPGARRSTVWTVKARMELPSDPRSFQSEPVPRRTARSVALFHGSMHAETHDVLLDTN